MSTTATPPADNRPTRGEPTPITVPGGRQPGPTACLLVTAVDENTGTLTGQWIDLDAPSGVASGAVLVLDRTSIPGDEHRGGADQHTHRTTSLFRWTDDRPRAVARRIQRQPARGTCAAGGRPARSGRTS